MLRRELRFDPEQLIDKDVYLSISRFSVF